MLVGGSNYQTFSADSPAPIPGVIAQFTQNQALIATQLEQMYANGQRRLRLIIPYFFQTSTDGYALPGDGRQGPGTLAHDNLTALLALIKSIGFQEILVEFGPEWDALPWSNPVYNAAGVEVVGPWPTDAADFEKQYQRGWNFMAWLRVDVIIPAGIPYRIGLCNEAAGQPYAMQYAKRLWADVGGSWSMSETIGFSIMPGKAAFAALPQVYQGQWPDAMDVHIYDGTPDYPSVVDVVTGTFAGLNAVRPGLKVICGEGFYYNGLYWTEIQRGLQIANADFDYMCQWPETSEAPAGGTGVNVIPTQFMYHH